MAATTTNTTNSAGGVVGVAPTGVEAYEDMFKEITRKLYGEETGHGLHTLGTPIAHVATTGPTVPEGERSFTTLISDRAGNTIDFTNDMNQNANKDHLFGLAALMQNGFPQPPGTILTSHTFSQANNKTASPNINHDEAPRWNNTAGASEAGQQELLQWNANQVSNSKPQSTGKGIKKEAKQDRASQGGNSSAAGAQSGSKRYTCVSCPYSTDRRDLFTRHENIHKTEKPFHCYACLKQFNRADHVKKHFLRMHRELQYDINKTRRSVSAKSPVNNSVPNNNTQYYGQQSATSSVVYPGQHNQEQLPLTGLHNTSEVIQQATQHLLHQQLSTPSPVVVAVQHQAANRNINGGRAMEPTPQTPVKVKQEKQPTTPTSASPKKKGDKRFVCCYCPWTGADNWGLKRHLNTHTKPFVCMLCDYKAARSERLVTHVYKVHNKKACSKCSFLADDHVQFLAHQSEAHPVDSRARPGGNNNQNNNHNSSPNQQSSVLRAIGNTFGSNVATNSNNMVSGSGSVSHTTPLFGNGFSHGPLDGWRPAGVVTNQKRGAERLFQYMEADGSDPEDYNKQLQMTALSRSARNTVAQDFHNAGGGVTTTTTTTKKETKIIKRAPSPKEALTASSLFANKQRFITDLEEFILQRLANTNRGLGGPELGAADGQLALSLNRGRSSIVNTPPPAKRRRSSHDKENYRHGKTTSRPKITSSDWPTDRVQLNAQMKEIFHTLSQHYGEQMLMTKDSHDVVPSGSAEHKKLESLERIERILKNNNELTISIRDSCQDMRARIKYTNGDSGLDEEEDDDEDAGDEELPGGGGKASRAAEGSKSKRKQFVPRKIGGSGDEEVRNNLAIWNRIRNKHLSRLMSHKKSCGECTRQQTTLTIPYHSVSSLLLHRRWRHQARPRSCPTCKCIFKLPYQLTLHRRLVHHK